MRTAAELVHHILSVLRVGRVSVAIRRFIHHSWYEPAGERSSWAGTAGQGPAIRTRQVLDRQGFLMSITICSSPGRIGSNKQCFHNQFMHTCLLRATV
jgi:hypothetical protein